MSNLSKLKIVAQAAKRQQTKSEHRRGKLLEKLGDQLAMIEAQINGETFTRMRRIWRTDRWVSACWLIGSSAPVPGTG